MNENLTKEVATKLDPEKEFLEAMEILENNPIEPSILALPNIIFDRN